MAPGEAPPYLSPMFDSIRRVLGETRDAFHSELRRRGPEDVVADLLSGMRREMVETRAALKEAEERIPDLRARLERERAEIERCDRRREMAERIDDDETARVAAEFGGRHRAIAAGLEARLTEAVADRDGLRATVEEMTARFRRAEAERHALVARVRAAGARDRMDSAAALDEWARMEERIDDSAHAADAAREMADESPPPGRSTPDEIERRLAELKRSARKDAP
jgi:phage shock protein A